MKKTIITIFILLGLVPLLVSASFLDSIKGFFGSITEPIFGGPGYSIERSIVPATHNTYDIGTSTNQWRTGYFTDIVVSSTCTGSGCGSGDAFTTTTINGVQSTSFTFNVLGTNGLSYSTSSNAISLTQVTSTGSQAGFLSAADWTTFNGKQSTLSFPFVVASTSPALASSSIAINIFDSTSTAPYKYAKWRSPMNLTITEVSCDEFAAATTTVQLYRADSLGSLINSSNIAASLTCGSIGYTTSTFTTSTIALGNFIVANVSSTAGTPTWTTINVQYQKTD